MITLCSDKKISKGKDLSEEDPSDEANKSNQVVKLDGNVGCMVNGLV